MKVIRSDNAAGAISARPSLPLYKQPKRTQTLGDGSELDAFDDLPVNRDKEKRFVKIPIRRRQSSGMASVDSVQSATTMTGTSAHARNANTILRRERMDSAPGQMEPVVKRPSGGALRSIGKATGKGDTSSHKTSPHLSVDDAKIAKSAKRPGLKLIRNLSASGLSRGERQTSVF